MKSAFTLISLMLLSPIFLSCEKLTDSDDENNTLHVRFVNSADSEYAISSIQVMIMGEAGEIDAPNGTFGDNLLKDGALIEPGTYAEFDMVLPNLYYSFCSIGIKDKTTGEDIILINQPNYTNLYQGTITHWGSDDRTVNTEVKYDSNLGYIRTYGWGEWAGIHD